MTQKHQWEKGDKLFIRTVTFHYIGELLEQTEDSFWLGKTVWVGDSGRWNEALSSGDLSEVEPYSGDRTVEVMRSAIVDISLWTHEIPSEVI